MVHDNNTHDAVPVFQTKTIFVVCALAAALLIAAVVAEVVTPLTVAAILAAGLAGAGLTALVMSSGQDRTINPSGQRQRDAQRLQWTSWCDVTSAVPEPAFLINASEVVVHDNAASRELFGKSLTERSLQALSRDPEFLASVDEARQTGQTRRTSFSLPGPLQRHLNATITPLQHPDSVSPDALFIVLRDTSEQQRLLEMRSDFIANASHELRTPLASLRGFIETLQTTARDDSGARERFLGIMSTQSERMTRLIDDLLLLSRVEENAYLPPRGKVDVAKILDDVAVELDDVARHRDITVHLNPNNMRGIVAGDRDELFQVFHNLIENAIKYGREGGRIDVDMSDMTEKPGAQPSLIISVRDDGPGIAAEHLPRLTERFYRVNADHSRAVGGTGLGLAIVKHILARHGGSLQFDSRPGHGTVAIVSIPNS